MNSLFWKGSHRKPSRKRSVMEAVKMRRMSLHLEPQIIFSTNSSYHGQWDMLGMRGYGYYSYFYGVDFDGNVLDSLFHGQGTLLYPNYSKMDGVWEHGHLHAHRYFFSDGLCYGPYCEMPDRRFYLEIRYKLKPAGRSLFSNAFDTRPIPEGCYDTEDGFYNPKHKCVYDPYDPTKILRIPTKEQHDWILKNCRKYKTEPVGYRPDLYENWFDADEELDESDYDKQKLIKKSIDYLSYRTFLT